MTIAKSKSPIEAKPTASNKPAAARKPQAAAKAAAAPAPAAEATKKSGKAPKKEKRVRSSFSMPESQFALIAELKTKCAAFGVTARKSELLAAGLRVLKSLSETALEAEILPSLRTDRKTVEAKPRKK